ncbi:hypothetical protein CD351_05365 [Erythrobacter sp. KY5]|uniref:hypothetical protein n=1 Tax=Erythrobacter sp. KY5 TaxID=2011159 RepID=UPI000DBEF835|nr:hypothetical protein [Erythrobacter sp. KY5]AWW73852.1 hypothetical protein CD351_05365 [Erythrobacter sp. KY5]
MSEASFASLGPTLLARKGGAKPAMRPQLAPLPEMVEPEQLEDLGWNDMGQDDEGASQDGANIVSIIPSATPEANADLGADNDVGSPLVHRQQRDLADRILADAATGNVRDEEPVEDEPVETTTLETRPVKSTPVEAPAKAKPTARKTSANARRAAFTLRLDTERHLKLRLAATMQGVSAQSLVTQALDSMLSEIEDLDALAQKMGAQMGAQMGAPLKTT